MTADLTAAEICYLPVGLGGSASATTREPLPDDAVISVERIILSASLQSVYSENALAVPHLPDEPGARADPIGRVELRAGPLRPRPIRLAQRRAGHASAAQVGPGEVNVTQVGVL
jgi:hypothetical protein